MTLASELERCRPWIEAALGYAGGTHLFEDVAKAIIGGEMQFWPAEHGCLITEIVQFPRKRVLNVFLGGGDMEQLVDMHDAVAEWGRQQGCDAFTITGRPGWQRVYKSRGWKPAHVVLTKEA